MSSKDQKISTFHFQRGVERAEDGKRPDSALDAFIIAEEGPESVQAGYRAAVAAGNFNKNNKK